MKKSKNYRDILAQAMGGVTFNKTMVVHHLNHDRSDNRVMNLLLIPRSLHSRYHAAYNELKVFRKIDLYKVDDQNIVCHRVIQEFFDYKADMEIFMYAQNHCIFEIQMGADIDQQIEIYCSSVKNLVKKIPKVMNYKYNIVINQKAIVDNGLSIDIVDAAVFDFIKDFSHSDKCVKMQIDGKTYFWITNQTIIDNLPLLQISTPRGISKRIDNLVDAELLVRCPNNQEMNKTLYAFGRRYDEYIFTSESRPWNESSDLGTVVPTPWNSCSDDNNNKNNNIIVVEDAHTHTREKSNFDYMLEWICDNGDGLQQMLYRNKLIVGLTSIEEMKNIILPYVQEYYEQQLMNGGEDIVRRGRRDIKQHFSQWLPKHLKKLQIEQQQKQQEYEQGIDPITRAMQDFAAGWDNAERRKQQEKYFERF